MPLIMFAIIFMWTPPHFWALSLWAHGDYARAKVPMLPVTHGARETRRQVMIYTVALVPVTLAPWFVGFSGLAYAGVATLLGAVFLVQSWRVLREAQDETGRSLVNDAAARATFRFSLYYLFALFGALAIDRLVF
jgi:protoheme IX farnesyltransferase